MATRFADDHLPTHREAIVLTRPAVDIQQGLERVLASVISRCEPILATSRWGGAVLLPSSYLAPWIPLVTELVALNQPDIQRVDAGMHTSRWDSITDLYDSDSGTWKVGTSDELFIFDMDARQLYGQRTGSGGTPMGREGFGAIVEVSVGAVATWSTARIGEVTQRSSRSAVTGIYRLDERSSLTSESEADVTPSGQFPARRSISVHDASGQFTDLVADVASRGDQISIETHSGSALMIAVDIFDSLAFLAQGVGELFPLSQSPSEITDVVHIGQQIVELRDNDQGLWHVQTENHNFIFDMGDRTIREAATDDDGELLFDRTRLRLPEIEKCRVGATIAWQGEISVGGGFVGNADDSAVLAITRLDPWSF
ncbi:hypothetical protein GCM10025867_48210 (plasmid) [Frondihabitans sucicola]|uniref:Uncharacterized protein n=1 Tax=Frondihabitans sucicola TaxID=1268041 RepID=A0ABM8GVT0_9MICO|nr:hypothetical protein [Frondihabitans sucicola]BDZ50515.1 hypothetical protein GCM10025867_27560 [Frondihabitans sucicola]BDZ52580.1 hypothetical protein GCM10025867_48210 [Frondihabitans sucicola]